VPVPASSPATASRKGALTRHAILDCAVRLATRLGLEGLTVGRLADELGMSKSGLFAHFRSKDALDAAVVEHAARQFVDAVVRPALEAPRGEPRLRKIFEGWLAWSGAPEREGGCLFVATATELDDRPGPARDSLVRAQRDWFDFIAGAVRIAQQEGHISRTVSPEQFAQDTYGIVLAWHHASRLLGDDEAGPRAHRAFDRLIVDAKAGER
jgi:AcrR family transcriptional regulator